MNTPPATLLVCHGSRDTRSQIAAERLLYLVREHYCLDNPILKAETGKFTNLLTKSPPPLLELGFLECSEIPLHQQIEGLAQKAIAQNCPFLQIFPLFLSSGVHVKEDIPQQVSVAQNNLKSSIKLVVKPCLGDSYLLYSLIAQRFQQIPSDGRILLAHGSRRTGGNDNIERMAKQLQANPAYWSIKPDLNQQIQQLEQQGHSHIVIMPYFLFNGGILDNIAQQIHELRLDYPHLTLSLGHPLGATPELAQLIVKELENE